MLSDEVICGIYDEIAELNPDASVAWVIQTVADTLEIDFTRVVEAMGERAKING